MIHLYKKSLMGVAAALAVPLIGATAFSVFVNQTSLPFVRAGTITGALTGEKVVALTFDDGPSPEWTPRLLDELSRLDAKATFFVLGEHVRQHPDLARRIARDGHEIENHTYRHPLLLFHSVRVLNREIEDCDAAVKAVTGGTTKYFRPPRAWLTNSQKAAINEMGYPVVLWSLNSKDWVTFDDRFVLKHILSNLKPGDIILFHDGGGIFGTDGRNRDETIRTVGQLVPELRKRGFRLVTVAELVESSGGALR